jgi:DNA-binding transcriptional LysR family regulator
MTCGDQFRALEEGKIDLGFVGLSDPIEERGFKFRSIQSYKTVVALAKQNPLAKKSIINLKDLEPMFFISLSETSYPFYRRWLTRTCRRAGFSPKILQDRLNSNCDDIVSLHCSFVCCEVRPACCE